MDISRQTIAVIGLGYVGLPLAVEFGKSRPVLGFDTHATRIEQLRTGLDNTLELGAPQLHEANHVHYSNDVADLSGCGVFIVAVPTPVDHLNRPDLAPLIEASQSIARAMKPGAVVIYESTVYPGCTEEVCVPILEAFSGMQFNKDFFCGYSPERIVPGDRVNTLTRIKKVTSGSTTEAARAIDALYASIITAGTFPVASIRVAEAAKVLENTQRDLNIALINECSIMFEKMGIDTMDVLEAAGSKWNFLPFRPGLVGGHCIGVDPYYLSHKAQQMGCQPQTILAGRRVNEDMARYAAHELIKRMLANGMDITCCTVGVLGLTAKENCPDIRNSKAVDLVRALLARGIAVQLADPMADADEFSRQYGLSLGEISAKNPVDALVIAVAHAQYRLMTPDYIRALCKPGTCEEPARPVVADLKSLYDRHALAALGLTVFRL